MGFIEGELYATSGAYLEPYKASKKQSSGGVADLRPATFLKKRLWHRCFPVNFAEFLRTAFLTEHLRLAASVSAVDYFAKSFILNVRQGPECAPELPAIQKNIW